MCPYLREKDILREIDADSPCKRIYLAIQLMYVDQENLADHHKTYWEMVGDVLRRRPVEGWYYRKSATTY